MPLLEDCKMDVIRHLEYEVIGLYQNQPSGGSDTLGNAGMRYFGPFGSLLYRINLLRPVEEAKITGVATGSIQFTGAAPTPGDVITATVNATNLSAPVVVSVTVPNPGILGQGWTLVSLAQELANAFMLTPAFQAAGFWALADYGPGPWSNQQVATPVMSINAPTSLTTFTLSATYTGQTVPQVISVPRPTAPFVTFRTVAGINTVYGFIPILNFLESAYGGASANLSATKASEVILRSDELQQRTSMYETYQQKLSTYLGVPVNRQAAGHTNTSMAQW